MVQRFPVLMMTYILLVAGLAILVVGAEILVRGAARIAGALGIAPLIIGLTIVAFGTSTPEFVVSTVAAYNGSADIAVGNVVGSNIFNVLFILGLSALIAPLIVSTQLIRQDVPIMIGVSLVTLIMSLDGAIARWEGILLVTGIVAYTLFLIRQSKTESNVAKEFEQEYGVPAALDNKGWALNVLYIAAGLGLLILGSDWLVTSAVEITEGLGVSKLVIGLTIVAAGTSLPEVATSVIATLKGERDIAVGNVVGSNIFNILCVLGASAAIAPASIPVSQAAVNFDIPAMIAVAIACFPIFFSGSEISRWEGLVFLGYYVAYTAYLVMAAGSHDGLDTFTVAMQYVVIPLTVLTLVLVSTREYRRRKAM